MGMTHEHWDGVLIAWALWATFWLQLFWLKDRALKKIMLHLKDTYEETIAQYDTAKLEFQAKTRSLCTDEMAQRNADLRERIDAAKEPADAQDAQVKAMADKTKGRVH